MTLVDVFMQPCDIMFFMKVDDLLASQAVLAANLISELKFGLIGVPVLQSHSMELSAARAWSQGRAVHTSEVKIVQ